MAGAVRFGLLNLVSTFWLTGLSDFVSGSSVEIAGNIGPTPMMSPSRRGPAIGVTKWTNVTNECAKGFVVF